MIKKFKLLVLFLLILFGFLLSLKAAKNQFTKGYGDNAFLAELVDNVGSFKGPLTMIAQSTAVSFTTWYSDAKEVCEKKYPMPTEPMNYFKRVHPYFILYLLAPLKIFFGSVNLLVLLMTVSFFGLFVFFIHKINQSQISLFAGLLLMHMLMSHPAWIGGLEGQAYVDRLYVLFGGLMFWLALEAKDKINKFFWVLLILIALVNDRTGLQAALALGAYGVLYYRKNPTNSNKYLICAAGLSLFSFFLIFRYVSGYATTESTSTEFFSEDTIWRIISLQTLTLLIYAFVLLGPWTAKHYRLVLVSLAAMLPNIFLSVGGAEKTGWVTHYHSGYLPILLAISVYAFVKEYKDASVLKKRIYLTYILFATLIFMSFPRDLKVSRDWQLSKSHSSLFKIYQLTMAKPEYERYVEQEISKIIKPNSNIASSEIQFKYFWNIANVFYFPAGLDEVDYVLLRQKAEFEFPDVAPSATSLENQKELNRCMWDRLQKNFSKNYPIPGTDLILLGR